MTKISVIIPVYNTEKYLPQCLESIINQTFKDIEIICINDASKDNSLSVIQEYAKKDNRIKYENFTANKGVSAARNYGINASCGDYIYFIDSDDWIETDYLEIMFKTIEETKSQIVMNRNMISFIDNKFYPYSFQQDQLKIQDNTYIDTEKDICNTFCGPCCKLYGSNLIKNYNLRFPEGFVYEDLFFHYVTFIYAQKVYFFNGSAYYYRKTENSITSKKNQNADKIINVMELVYDFYKQNNLLDKKAKIYYTMPSFNISDEKTYNAFKNYFNKAGEYILNNDLYNDMDRFVCKNILETNSYEDYIGKYPANVAISYIRRKK